MQRLVFVAMTVMLCARPAAAQQPGQIGIYFDAQLVPQVGLHWHATDRFSLRLGVYGEGDSQEVVDRGFISLSVLRGFDVGEPLSTYLGADVTYSSFNRETLLGLLYGARYALHRRFAVFGEFGLSIGVGEHVTGLRMFNTGAGVVYYFR